jgi:uncharacterized membrane protein YGL010W
MGGGGYDFLLQRLVFYQSYHSNFWNKVIHVICIPAIVWAVLVWLCAIQVTLPVVDVKCDVALLVTIMYSTLYVWADVTSGITWTLFVGAPLYTLATILDEHHSETSYRWALFAFVMGFYIQVHAGHYVFEKRKPALVDSFLEAMLAAPLFVWLEVIFALGFKQDMRTHVEGEAAKLIKQYNREKKKSS